MPTHNSQVTTRKEAPSLKSQISNRDARLATDHWPPATFRPAIDNKKRDTTLPDSPVACYASRHATSPPRCPRRASVPRAQPRLGRIAIVPQAGGLPGVLRGAGLGDAPPADAHPRLVAVADGVEPDPLAAARRGAVAVRRVRQPAPRRPLAGHPRRGRRRARLPVAVPELHDPARRAPAGGAEVRRAHAAAPEARQGPRR